MFCHHDLLRAIYLYLIFFILVFSLGQTPVIIFFLRYCIRHIYLVNLFNHATLEASDDWKLLLQYTHCLGVSVPLSLKGVVCYLCLVGQGVVYLCETHPREAYWAHENVTKPTNQTNLLGAQDSRGTISSVCVLLSTSEYIPSFLSRDVQDKSNLVRYIFNEEGD